MSESRETSRRYGSATLSALRNRIDDYSEVLYEETFMASDLDGDRLEAKSVISFLKAQNAIKSVGKERDEESNKLINVWAWKHHQDDVQEHWEDRNELKCGCRAHIPPERDGEQYVCKFCGATHSKDEIKRAL